ncbi:hypothetical protein EMIT0P291_40004 [Pseudomonas sp. IT-P291]
MSSLGVARVAGGPWGEGHLADITIPPVGASLLAMAVVQSQVLWLKLRYREQARSHRVLHCYRSLPRDHHFQVFTPPLSGR